MISWITPRGSAPGSACAAIAHRLSPGWTITEVRLRYTAEAGGPLRAASARVAPAVHASTATEAATPTVTEAVPAMETVAKATTEAAAEVMGGSSRRRENGSADGSRGNESKYKFADHNRFSK